MHIRYLLKILLKIQVFGQLSIASQNMDQQSKGNINVDITKGPERINPNVVQQHAESELDNQFEYHLHSNSRNLEQKKEQISKEEIGSFQNLIFKQDEDKSIIMKLDLGQSSLQIHQKRQTPNEDIIYYQEDNLKNNGQFMPQSTPNLLHSKSARSDKNQTRSANLMGQLIQSQNIKLQKQNNRQELTIGERERDYNVEIKRKGLSLLLKIVIGVIILITLGTILGLIFSCRIPIGSFCQEVQSGPPALVVGRSFQRNMCFLLKFYTYTELENNGNLTITSVDHSLYLCLKNMTNQTLQFIGYLKKISVTDLTADPPTIQYFESDVGFQSTLFFDQNVSINDNSSFNGDASFSMETQSQFDNSTNSTNPNIDPSLFNGTGTVNETLNKINMFRVSVFTNGTIDTLSFNTLNDNSTIGQLPKYLKMFFPSLDYYLYNPARRLQQNNQTNSTNNLNNMDNYDFSQSESGDTNLFNQQIQYPNENDTTNTMIQKNSTSSFDSQGNLNSANMDANAEIDSRPEPDNDTYQVINFNLSINLQQNIQMFVNHTYRNLTQDDLVNFEAYFVSEVEAKSLSLTCTQEELKDYLMGNQSDDTTNGNNTRLLLNADGSLTLISRTFKVQLLRTNVLGVRIQVTGNAEAVITLYQIDKYRKQPRLQSQAYLELQLGPIRHRQYFFYIYKEFAAIPLSFTLNQVETFMNLIKGDFIAKVKQIANLASHLKFNDEFLPQILSIATNVESLYQAATNSQNQLLPIGQITTVVNYVQDIIDAINTNGQSLLTSRSGILQELVGKIDAFFNETYLANLNIFQTIKNQVLAGDINSRSLIQAFVLDGQTIAEDYFANCSLIKNSQLQRLFEDQIAKMAPLFTLYNLIDSKVIDVTNNLTTFKVSLRDNFRTNFEAFWNQFNKAPLDVVNQAKTLIDSQIAQTTADFNNLKNSLESSLSTKVDEVLSSTIRKVILEISDYSTSLPSLIQQSQTYLAQIRNQVYQFKIFLEYQITNGVPTFRKSFSGWTCFTSSFVSICNELYSLDTTIQTTLSSLADIQSLASQAKDFLNMIDLILQDGSSISNKVERIRSQFYRVNNFVSRFNTVKNKYQQFLNQMLGAKHELEVVYSCAVGYCLSDPYGICRIYQNFRQPMRYSMHTNTYSGGIHKLYKSIVLIVDKIQTFQATINTIAYFQKIQDYISVVNNINLTIYSQFQDQSQLLSQLATFYNDTTNTISTFEGVYTSFIDVKNNCTNSFLSGLDIISNISVGLESVTTWMDDACAQNSTFSSGIYSAQQSLTTLRDNINTAIGSNPVMKEVYSTYISALSTTFLPNFDPLFFCKPTFKTFVSEVTAAINDTIHFQEAKELIQQSMAMYSRVETFVTDTTTKIKVIGQNVKHISSVSDITNVINGISLFANETIDFVSNFGIQFTTLKEKCTYLQQFTTINTAQVDSIVSQLQSIESNFDSVYLMDGVQQQIQTVNSIINSVDYEVLAVINAINDTLAVISTSKKTIVDGGPLIMGNFSSLVQSFVNLDQFVTQQHLIEIQNSFEALIDTINTTVKTPIMTSLTSVAKFIDSLNITKKSLNQYLSNVSLLLKQYTSTVKTIIEDTNNQYGRLINSSLSLIRVLKIGYLRQLKTLGSDLTNIFADFVKEWAKKTFSLQTVKQIILKDIFNVKGSASAVSALVDELEASFIVTTNQMSQLIAQKLGVVQVDPETYNMLMNSQAFQQLNTLIANIDIDFGAIRSIIGDKLQKIKDFESNLTQELLGNLEKLSDIRKKVNGIKSSIQSRVKLIQGSFKNITKQFTQVEQLIFGILRNSIEGVIIRNMNQISDNIDNIFLTDLVNLENLTSSLPSQFSVISQMISGIIDGYQTIKQSKDSIKVTILTQVNKITLFIQDQLINKFAILKQSQKVLQSLPSMDNPSSDILIYNKVLLHEVVPIYEAYILVLTPIGPFLISFNLDFYYGCDLRVGITNFRDVYVELRFSTGLSMYCSFEIFLIVVRAGVYFDGQLLDISPRFGLMGKQMLPVTLIPQLAALQQFKTENRFELVNYLYIKINAFSFEVGGFVGFIMIRFRWLRIRICIGRRWFRFCFRFYIPIIEFYWLYIRHGYRFNGIALLDKKVYELSLLKFQY